jgi:hypothetical protein
MDRTKSIKLRSKSVAAVAAGGPRRAAGVKTRRVTTVTKASPAAVKSKAAAQPAGARPAKKEKKVEPIVLSDSSSEEPSIDDDDVIEGAEVEEFEGDEAERTGDESEEDIEQVRLYSNYSPLSLRFFLLRVQPGANTERPRVVQYFTVFVRSMMTSTKFRSLRGDAPPAFRAQSSSFTLTASRSPATTWRALPLRTSSWSRRPRRWA